MSSRKQQTLEHREKVEAAREYGLLETTSAPGLDRLTRLASRLLGAPVSIVAVACDDAFLVRSAHGIPAERKAPTSLPVNDALCQSVLYEERTLSIPDIQLFNDTDQKKIVGNCGIRSYLGTPLRLSSGIVTGVFSVCDFQPRDWTDDEITALEDLTALVMNELELRQVSEEFKLRFRENEAEHRRKEVLLESIGQGIYAIDAAGICHFINRAGANMLGYEPEQVIGRQMHDLVHHSHPDGTPMPREECPLAKAMLEGDTVTVSEHVFWTRDRKPVTVELRSSPVSEDGLITGSVVRFTEVSEQQRQENQLRESELRKSAMFETALDCIITIDHEGRIVEFNAAAEQTFGYSREQAVGRPMADLIMPSDQRSACLDGFARHLQTGESTVLGERLERPAMRADGSIFQTEMAVTRIDLPGSDHPLFTAYLRDITSRKEAEERIHFFKNVVDSVAQAVMTTDLDGRVMYWNKAAERLYGWREDEVIGKPVTEITPAEHSRERAREILAAVRTGETWSGDFQVRGRDGAAFTASVTCSPIYSDTGAIVGIIGISGDITEAKQTEQDLRLFKHIVDAVGESVVASDMDRRIVYANRAAEQALGWSLEDVSGRDIRDVVPADSYRDKSTQIGTEVRQSAEPWTGEFELRRSDGETFPALVSLAPILGDDSEPVGTIGVYTDISRMKQTEQELRFYKHAVDAVGQVVIANDLDRRVTYWNDAAEELLGWKADEVLGKDVATIAPARAFLHNVPEVGRLVRQGKTWSGEFLLQHRDGTEIPALSTIKPILDESGELIGLLGAHTDIREIKQTEQELRFHKHIVDAVGQAVVVSDTAGRITYWNRAAEEIYGWTADEALGQYVFELISADQGVERATEVTGLVAGGETVSGEFMVRHKSGHTFPGYFTVSPIRNADDEIVGVIGVSHDISERKEYERQIEFHRVMLDDVGQAVVATDNNRVISYWSKGAEEALGWTAEEVLGRPIADFAPAAHLKDEAGDLHRRVRQGESWTGEFPIRRKDGSTFPAVVSLAPIRIGYDETVGVIGVYTDVSDLKETERQLLIHRDMLDAVGQAVLATDDQLRITYWNRAAEELYGYDAGEAIGTHMLDLMPTGSSGHFQAVNAIEVLSREGGWTGEMVNYHKDGTEISVLASATPILSEGGEQVGLIAAMADITERKATEEALKESNRQITEILETMGDGFISLDRDWCMTYVNKQAEHILGRGRDELLGRFFWTEFPEPEDEPFYRKFLEAFETDQPVSITDYDPFLAMWLEVQAFPSGDMLSVFFRDVTARRQSELAIREAEERYRTLVEQLPAMTYIASADDVSNVTYVSPQVADVFGYSPEEWKDDSKSWVSRLHPDDREYVLREDALTNQSRERFTMEYRQRTRDGAYRWIRDTGTLIRDVEGNPRYWQGLSYDITAEKDAARSILESEQRFRSLFDNHPDAVFSIDGDGRVLTANPAFLSLTGCDADDLGTLRFVDLVLPDDQDRVQQRFDQTHRGESQEFHAAINDHNGERTELSVTTIPIVVDDEIVGVHVVAQDVTIHQELENQLAHQAFHDSLTGLPNRNLFQNWLNARMHEARNNDSKFAVLFFDLDDFKVINDSLGHSAGDQLLVEAAGRVQTCIRSNDLLARQGGDEFTILLEHVGDERDAKVIARRIAQVLDRSFTIDGHEVFVTTSIGIAIGDGTSLDPDDILRNADMAMYEAKNSGKNRYALFEPGMNSRAWLRLTLETEIRRALNRDEFVVHYQPIVDLNTGEIEGVEALVRWDHPERGFLAPQEFISVAEQSGLILPLGRWVLETATSQLIEWQRMLPGAQPLRLSLNLSSKQYQHPAMIQELTDSLESVQFNPELITMEITENIAMDDAPNTTATLQRLKDVGVQLALDDFGTGFSALSYLRRFPIDIIKIDQSFVSGLGVDPEDTSIVEAVMAASLAMQLRVIAEGIETADQLNQLRSLGCHLGQGYLISPPLSAVNMEQFLQQPEHPWQAFID